MKEHSSAGKNNRLLHGALALLIFTNIASLVWMYVHPHSIEKQVAQYPLIDPARNFIPQEDFIVNVQPLREQLRLLADTYGEGDVSIYVEYLNTGANISINPDERIWPASLSKLPLAMAVMKKIERGEWELSNELVLLEEDRNAQSGDAIDPLLEYPIGTRFTIEQLLAELLTNSDNTAFNILLRNLHNNDIEAVIDALGLEQLFTPDGKVSAHEYSRMFRSLYTSSFLTRQNSGLILAWLQASPFEDFLASGIPDTVAFPHKYGENVSLGVYADSGIVYINGRPFVMTVMVKTDPEAPDGGGRERAVSLMKAVATKTYDFFSQP